MAQPTEYERQYSFTDFDTSNPDDPKPGDQLDLEFNAIKQTSDQIRANLALIQRDDGALANNSVGSDQLKSEVDFGFNDVVDWDVGIDFVARDGAWYQNKLYRCLEAHTSTVFATDLAAGRWAEILDLSTALASAASSATDAATSATASASSATASASSATASASSATAAAASATAAASSATAAAASATTAANLTRISITFPSFATTAMAVGDGWSSIFVPSYLNGMNLVALDAQVATAGTTGTLDIQIYNVTQAADMLTTKLTIDSGERTSLTAATPAVIDTANDDVATGDELRVDIDAVHTTAALGLVVHLYFELP